MITIALRVNISAREMLPPHCVGYSLLYKVIPAAHARRCHLHPPPLTCRVASMHRYHYIYIPDNTTKPSTELDHITALECYNHCASITHTILYNKGHDLI